MVRSTPSSVTIAATRSRRSRKAFADAGLDLVTLRYTNPIGLLGWMYNAHISKSTAHSLTQVKLFETLVAPWALPLERLISPPIGLSLVAGRSATRVGRRLQPADQSQRETIADLIEVDVPREPPPRELRQAAERQRQMLARVLDVATPRIHRGDVVARRGIVGAARPRGARAPGSPDRQSGSPRPPRHARDARALSFWCSSISVRSRSAWSLRRTRTPARGGTRRTPHRSRRAGSARIPDARARRR